MKLALFALIILATIALVSAWLRFSLAWSAGQGINYSPLHS